MNQHHQHEQNNQVFQKHSQFSVKLTRCSSKLNQIFCQNDVDSTHGIQHAMIVVNHGLKSIEAVSQISEQQKEDIIFACLLHDADDKKYFPSHNKYQNAQKLLTQQRVQQQRIDRIIGMISAVSFSKNGDKIDQSKPQTWYYPRYSDRIDAIGIKGLIRAYEYAKVVNNPMTCPSTEKPKSLEQLQNICKGRDELYIRKGGKSISFIDHIYDKLYHLKLPKQIKNPYFISKYEEGKQQIIKFVMESSLNNFESIHEKIEEYMKKQNQLKFVKVN